jgi:anaerobic magnesium-protoporphyrin IX monomethyl ester cyclase
MENIVLVVPPGLPGTTPNREAASGMGSVSPEPRGFFYPPHTVATMAAVLRAAGRHVIVQDAVARNYDTMRCLREILAAKPSLVGMFVSYSTHEEDTLFLTALRRELPRAVPVVCFGVATPFIAEDLAMADHLLLGEPELSFLALADRLLRREDQLPHQVAPDVLGVEGYDHWGMIKDLDALPMPAWDLLPTAQYSFLSILSSRGCPGRCTWCPYVVVQGRRFRACSPERVLAELRHVVRQHHPHRIVFRDPVFAHDRERVVRICQGILEDRVLRHGRALLWECESRPEHFDGELLRLMNLAGCISIKVGLETTNPDVLVRQGRVASYEEVESYLAHVRQLVNDCSRLGIMCRLFVLAGLPGQTVTAARMTARFIDAIKPDAISVNTLRDYPGLRLHRQPWAEETYTQWEVLFRAQMVLAQTGTGRRPSRLWPTERFLLRATAPLRHNKRG